MRIVIFMAIEIFMAIVIYDIVILIVIEQQNQKQTDNVLLMTEPTYH